MLGLGVGAPGGGDSLAAQDGTAAREVSLVPGIGAGDWCNMPPNLCMPSTFLPPLPFQLSANLSSLVTRLSKMLHDESEIKEGIDGKVKVSAAVFLQAMDARVQERLPDSTPHM